MNGLSCLRFSTSLTRHPQRWLHLEVNKMLAARASSAVNVLVWNCIRAQAMSRLNMNNCTGHTHSHTHTHTHVHTHTHTHTQIGLVRWAQARLVAALAFSPWLSCRNILAFPAHYILLFVVCGYVCEIEIMCLHACMYSCKNLHADFIMFTYCCAHTMCRSFGSVTRRIKRCRAARSSGSIRYLSCERGQVAATHVCESVSGGLVFWAWFVLRQKYFVRALNFPLTFLGWWCAEFLVHQAVSSLSGQRHTT